MNFGQSIREALESVSSNKLRAALTILGIVIGVAAVIAMLAVGAGAQDTILGLDQRHWHKPFVCISRKLAAGCA